MHWRVLTSAPYLLLLPHEYRSRLKNEGAEITAEIHAVDTIEDLILIEGLIKAEAATFTEPSAVAPDAGATSGDSG